MSIRIAGVNGQYEEQKGPSPGRWGAQAVKRLSLDFGSGHHLMVHEFEPHVRLRADSAEPAWDSLSPFSLCFSPNCALSLSLSKKGGGVT